MVKISMEIRTSQPYDKVEALLKAAAEGIDESAQITSERAVMSIAITSLKGEAVEYTIGIWRKDPVSMESSVSMFLKRFHESAVKNGISVLSTHVKL
jgi:hypothetical protein